MQLRRIVLPTALCALFLFPALASAGSGPMIADVQCHPSLGGNDCVMYAVGSGEYYADAHGFASAAATHDATRQSARAVPPGSTTGGLVLEGTPVSVSNVQSCVWKARGFVAGDDTTTTYGWVLSFNNDQTQGSGPAPAGDAAPLKAGTLTRGQTITATAWIWNNAAAATDFTKIVLAYTC